MYILATASAGIKLIPSGMTSVSESAERSVIVFLYLAAIGLPSDQYIPVKNPFSILQKALLLNGLYVVVPIHPVMCR